MADKKTKTIKVVEGYGGRMVLHLPDHKIPMKLTGGATVRLTDVEFESDSVQRMLKIGYLEEVGQTKKEEVVEVKTENQRLDETKTKAAGWDFVKQKALTKEESKEAALEQIGSKETDEVESPNTKIEEALEDEINFIDEPKKVEEVEKVEEEPKAAKKTAKKTTKKTTKKTAKKTAKKTTKKTAKKSTSAKAKALLEKAASNALIYENGQETEIDFVDDLQKTERAELLWRQRTEED